MSWGLSVSVAGYPCVMSEGVSAAAHVSQVRRVLETLHTRVTSVGSVSAATYPRVTSVGGVSAATYPRVLRGQGCLSSHVPTCHERGGSQEPCANMSQA